MTTKTIIMIWYCSFLLAIGLVSALPSKNVHPLSDEFIQAINSKQSTWKAGRNFEIEEYDLFKILASGLKKNSDIEISIKVHNEDEEVPESFDSREAWSDCADIIGLIRDQSRCGSCWAFSTVEVMSDRICIHSNATKKILVSAENLLTCGNVGGCGGGDPQSSFGFWERRGIVSGGLYNRPDQGCQPYFLPPCEDHMANCTRYVNEPVCKRVCNDSSLDYNNQETYGLTPYTLTGEKQIQLEILKNGPVESGFTVYEDFASYKSGIYQYVTGSEMSGHSIKIIGWGVEDGVKYWLIANSWNERWGENGYFKIIRGQNEVGIEDSISAALPDFSRF